MGSDHYNIVETLEKRKQEGAGEKKTAMTRHSVINGTSEKRKTQRQGGGRRSNQGKRKSSKPTARWLGCRKEERKRQHRRLLEPNPKHKGGEKKKKKPRVSGMKTI